MNRFFALLLSTLLLAAAARGATISLGIDGLEQDGFQELKGKHIGW